MLTRFVSGKICPQIAGKSEVDETRAREYIVDELAKDVEKLGPFESETWTRPDEKEEEKSPLLETNPSLQRFDSTKFKDGRVGPYFVALSELFPIDGFTIRQVSYFKLEAKTNFPSARANCAVFKGKWMYEVVLITEGIFQLGWATLDCEFSDQYGVGDSKDSFAYDGKRICKWSGDQEQYGEGWKAGDTIGICFDGDAKEMTFYRNGVSLGVAFNKANIGSGKVFFPTLSLSQGQACLVNFGMAPFHFPVEGYKAIQIINKDVQERAKDLANIVLECGLSTSALQNFQLDVVHVAKLSAISKRIFAFLTNIETKSHIISHLVSALVLISKSRHLSVSVQIFSILLSLAPQDSSFLSPFLTSFFETLSILQFSSGLLPLSKPPKISHLFSSSSSSSSEPKPLDQLQFSKEDIGSMDVLKEGNGGVEYLRLALEFMIELDHETLVMLLAKNSFFVEILFVQKPPNEKDLERFFPTLFWADPAPPASFIQDHPEFDEEKTKQAKEEMKRRFEVKEQIKYEALKRILEDDKKAKVFVEWLENVVRQSMAVYSSAPIPGISCPGCLSSLYNLILRFLAPRLSSPDCMRQYPLKWLSTSRFAEEERLGGILSFLLANDQVEWDSLSGPDEVSWRSSSSNEESQISPEVFFALFNIAIGLHNVGMIFVAKSFVEISKKKRVHTQTIQKFIGAGEVLFQSTYKEILHLSRLELWAQSTVFTEEKLSSTLILSTALSQLLSMIVEYPSSSLLFYVPDYIAESFRSLFSFLTVVDPFNGSKVLTILREKHEEKHQIVNNYISALLLLLRDQRIRKAEMREGLCLSLYEIFREAKFAKTFQANEESIKYLFEVLFGLFNGKTWVYSLPMINMIWSHEDKNSAPLYFPIRDRFPEFAHEHSEIVATHLNKAVDYLDWSTTEFFVCLKNIENADEANSQEDLAKLEKRITALCDLAHKITMMMENLMPASASIVYSSELLLQRFSEMTVMTLNRFNLTSKQLDYFVKLFLKKSKVPQTPEEVQKAKIKELTNIYKPISGLLVSLLNYSPPLASSSPPSLVLAKSLLHASEEKMAINLLRNLLDDQLLPQEGALQIRETVECLIGSIEELSMRASLGKQLNASKNENGEEEEEDLCAICYTDPCDTIFIPCSHTSCSHCISRHLADHTTCFFCKATISSTQPLSHQ